MARARKESDDSAARYYNKLVVQLKGRGYSDSQAEAQAVEAVAKRYAGFGAMQLMHSFITPVLERAGVNKVFYGPYFAFVNEYIRWKQKGDPEKASLTIREFAAKGLDRRVLNQLVSIMNGEVTGSFA